MACTCSVVTKTPIGIQGFHYLMACINHDTGVMCNLEFDLGTSVDSQAIQNAEALCAESSACRPRPPEAEAEP